jgi:hypothetical protein
VLGQLRSCAPSLPVVVFSDGSDSELRPILGMPGVARARPMSAMDDIWGLASASVLVASSSTFSAWGAFLGNAPVIWNARAPLREWFGEAMDSDRFFIVRDMLPENARKSIRRAEVQNCWEPLSNNASTGIGNPPSACDTEGTA